MKPSFGEHIEKMNLYFLSSSILCLHLSFCRFPFTVEPTIAAGMTCSGGAWWRFRRLHGEERPKKWCWQWKTPRAMRQAPPWRPTGSRCAWYVCSVLHLVFKPYSFVYTQRDAYLSVTFVLNFVHLRIYWGMLISSCVSIHTMYAMWWDPSSSPT